MDSKLGLCAAVALVATTIGCAGSPAAPFNSLPNSQVTALRLQNYEPPAAPAAAPGAAGVPTIPGIPPEIQSWVNQGAAGLRQLIPPGLQIPGLGTLPGANPGPATPASVDQAPRFHGFRILQQSAVMDDGTRDKIAKVLGDASNFESGGPGCMYPEMGVSFSPSMGAPPNDVLISFSCRQVAAFNFAWPHQGTTMKASTVEKLADIVHRIWPQGS